MPFIATEHLDPPVPQGARRTAWRDPALCARVVCAVAPIVDVRVVTASRGDVRTGATPTAARAS